MALDLWDLCAKGILDQDAIIDLRTHDPQRRYFANSVMKAAVPGLWFQRSHKELVVKRKGRHVEHMMIDDDGQPTGLLIDQFDPGHDNQSYSGNG